jgi:Na+/proline symporter
MGKLNTIDFSFNLNDRYTFWSGLLGGTFLALSYFGTDQSQVQRYLSGSSVTQSRMGLLVNGIVKVPMQFFILYVGAMVFVFYQFVAPPLFFNPVDEKAVKSSDYTHEYLHLEDEHLSLHEQKRKTVTDLLTALDDNDEELVTRSKIELNHLQEKTAVLKQHAIELIKKNNPSSDGNDINYIFLRFVLGFLPTGLIGLVLAAILSASMSSTSAELNALASTSVIDIYRRIIKKDGTEKHYLIISKIATIFWGAFAILFALFANQLGSLIEAVNILGSLFYGTILGIFLIAFYIKKIGGNATFLAACIAEIIVLVCYFFTAIPYLWFNVIGCVSLVLIALILQSMMKHESI